MIYKNRKKKLTLYQKYAIVVITAAIVPIALLVTTFLSSLIRRYQAAMLYQYQSASNYVSADETSLIDSYNTISKIPYYYNLSGDETTTNNKYSFDSFRQFIYGEIYSPETMEEDRESDMLQFLQYLQSVNSDIVAIHFLMYDQNDEFLSFHYSSYATYMADEEKFKEYVDYENWDKESKDLAIVPTHETDYYTGIHYDVITLGRNYFDLRGQVGSNQYVGTLFIDIKLTGIESIFRHAEYEDNEECFVVDANGYCLYSNVEDYIGENVLEYIEEQSTNENSIVITTSADDYGLCTSVIVKSESVYGSIISFKRMLQLVCIISVGIIVLSSFVISKKMTKPIYDMMQQMEKVETGDFAINLESNGTDEIGILSDRFNQMCITLENYINQSYVAKLKQNQAEMTALKSQIYPHFLYNTLEIIRMTAIEEEEERVGKMIEALSEQIRYIIGNLDDMVPIEKELEIVRKYIYLINCRYQSKIQLEINRNDGSHYFVPKLILQPVVENAYVHGLKPKNGTGIIQIDITQAEEDIEISVMDNGVGMSEDRIQKIYELFESEDIGIKNEYNWQSIGIKNVNDRIRYMYGKEYGVTITSKEGFGTNVSIKVPIRNGEDINV